MIMKRWLYVVLNLMIRKFAHPLRGRMMGSIYMISTNPSTKRSASSMLGLSDLLKTPSSRVSVSVPTPSSSKKETAKMARPRKNKAFTRMKRSEGMIAWVNEINILRRQLSATKDANIQTQTPSFQQDSPVLSGISVFIELAKSLLYSGSPDQSLELYNAYYNLIICASTNDANLVYSDACNIENTSPPIVPDAKLVSVAIRAHITMGNIPMALKMISACPTHSVQFDSDAKSHFISDLAVASAQGLQAALLLRDSMKERGELISHVGYSGLLSGIRMHGLKGLRDGSRLLMDVVTEAQTLTTESPLSAFRLTAKQAEVLAIELMDEFIAGGRLESPAAQSKKKMGFKKVHAEFLRVLFRVGMKTAKSPMNRNFENEARLAREAEALEGIRLSVKAMTTYKIGWDSTITDLLIDECLLIGDVSAVQFIVTQMNVNDISARTSTFNSVLRQYATSGDGEAAHKLLQDMKAAPETAPNDESYSLLLRACMRTERCRHYISNIIVELQDECRMFKEAYDRWIELKILKKEAYGDVLQIMAEHESTQPDADTILIMLGAFRKARNWEGALNLYRLQAHAQGLRTQYKREALESGVVGDGSNKSKSRAAFEELDSLLQALPPPYKSTVDALLELLRDMLRFQEARDVLLEQCEQAEADPRNYASSGSHCTPDSTSFALALEACVEVARGGRQTGTTPAALASTKAGSITADTQQSDQLASRELVKRGEVALELFGQLERRSIGPTRRIYASLIRVFALRGDIPSALGVFEECTARFAVDVSCLQSILDACLGNPRFLRTLVHTLEKLSTDENLSLNVFCGEILLQGFPDSRSLGSALVGMEQRCEVAQRAGFEVVFCSLDVLSVLVQGARQGSSVKALTSAMLYLGSVGIQPDAATMEYFRIPERPAKGSPGSKRDSKVYDHGLKQRSLLDLDMPEGVDMDTQPASEVPYRGPIRSQAFIHADDEPYFNAGADGSYSRHVAALKQGLRSDDYRDDDLEEDELNLSEDARLTLAEAALEWGAETGDAPLEINEQFLQQRSPLRRRDSGPGPSPPRK